jgi:hypothetical protein
MSKQTPKLPEGKSLAQFTDYKAAVSFVENLIENDFPANAVSIVGTDLRTVEKVRGKLGYGRVALSGMFTGSWVGMFFGLLLGASSTVTEQDLLGNIGAGIVIGAGIGMLINVIRFSMTKNRRGFISAQAVVAKKYEVFVPTELLETAKSASAKKPETKNS